MKHFGEIFSAVNHFHKVLHLDVQHGCEYAVELKAKIILSWLVKDGIQKLYCAMHVWKKNISYFFFNKQGFHARKTKHAIMTSKLCYSKFYDVDINYFNIKLAWFTLINDSWLSLFSKVHYNFHKLCSLIFLLPNTVSHNKWNIIIKDKSRRFK